MSSRNQHRIEIGRCSALVHLRLQRAVCALREGRDRLRTVPNPRVLHGRSVAPFTLVVHSMKPLAVLRQRFPAVSLPPFIIDRISVERAEHLAAL